MIVQAVFHEAEEGGYWAEIPVLPGCFTFAASLDELKLRLEEAVSVHLGPEFRLTELKLLPGCHGSVSRDQLSFSTRESHWTRSSGTPSHCFREPRKPQRPRQVS